MDSATRSDPVFCHRAVFTSGTRDMVLAGVADNTPESIAAGVFGSVIRRAHRRKVSGGYGCDRLERNGDHLVK